MQQQTMATTKMHQVLGRSIAILASSSMFTSPKNKEHICLEAVVEWLRAEIGTVHFVITRCDDDEVELALRIMQEDKHVSGFLTADYAKAKAYQRGNTTNTSSTAITTTITTTMTMQDVKYPQTMKALLLSIAVGHTKLVDDEHFVEHFHAIAGRLARVYMTLGVRLKSFRMYEIERDNAGKKPELADSLMAETYMQQAIIDLLDEQEQGEVQEPKSEEEEEEEPTTGEDDDGDRYEAGEFMLFKME